MQKHADVVLDRKGNVVPGALVWVKTSTGANAALYAANGSNQIPNPVTTDDFGRFAFYAANGRYSLRVYIDDVLLTSSLDVLLEDPLELTPENIQGGVIRDAALSNVTIDGKAPAYKPDTDALAARATALENRATVVEGRTTGVESRVSSLEAINGGAAVIPDGLAGRLISLESGAVTTRARVSELELGEENLDARITSLAAITLEEAPINEKSYARKNGAWTALPPDIEHWDAAIYLPTMTLGPNNRVAELYPRLNLSRPVLANCYARRAVAANENLTLQLKPTSGTDWTATCVIPAGQLEGYFVSGDVQPIDSSQGLAITPVPVPSQAVTGLAITLRFEIEVEQTLSLLSVPQPEPVDTIVVFGQSGLEQTKPSFNLRKLQSGASVMSADAAANIATYQNASARSAGMMAYLKENGSLVVADLLTGATVVTLAGGVARKGASLSEDSSRVLTAEYRSGKWYSMEYKLPSLALHQQIDLSTYGVGDLNAIRYSPNDRYIMVGHASAGLVLNALNKIALEMRTPLTGNILDVDITPSIYAVMTRSINDFTLNITTNGQLMTRNGSTAWQEITCSGFNWFTDVPSQYPYFLVGGLTAQGWQVVPYSASDFSYAEMPWKINFGERIVGLAYSEAVSVDDVVTESTFGRAVAVFGEHGYKVYDLLTGVEIGAQVINTYNRVAGGFWKFVPGVFE